MNRDDYEDYNFEDDEEDQDYDPEQDEMEEDDEMEFELEEQLERAADDVEQDTESSMTFGELLRSDNSGRTLSLLVRLLNSRRVEADEDDDIDEGIPGGNWNNSSQRGHHQYAPAKTPQPAGVQLLQSGAFGNPDATHRAQPLQRSLSSAKRSLSPPIKSEIFRGLVPNTVGTVVAKYGSNVYAGQFSTDSSFYYTCVQDFHLHLYDMKAPIRKKTRTDGDHQSTLKHNKTIRAAPGGWTITDSHLSPDNTLLAYAIMSSTVFVASTKEGETEQRSLFFGQNRREYEWRDRYGIWSCRFSADGKELVAGGSGKLMVYDLIADQRSVKIEAHRADVNSCCWADNSGNILISASDDSFVKVWDRRSLGNSQKPSGVLIGHTEGITYVAPKGDGRYVISNGKDQTLKLWDLRKMVSFSDFLAVKDDDYGIPDFDYRSQLYPKPRYDHHPKDCSVMSYRGHSVLRTLIRCNFSPAETTGSRYIYSGSEDGIVHIWNLDGTVVQKIDRRVVREMEHHPSETDEPLENIPSQPIARSRGTMTVVRDAAWHSQEPVLMTCSWSSLGRPSEVAKHEWKGLNKLGGRLEDFAEKEEQEARERRRHIPRVPYSTGSWY